MMRARASEDFATRLEHALRSAPGPGGDEDQAMLVALAVGLRDAARPLAGVVPRQEFRAALAERLAEQARELEPQRRAAAVRAPRGGAVATARPAQGPLRGVLAGLVALAVAGGAGAAVASENALPGGALYPLKRQVEELRLQLSSPGSTRGGTELALARERLVEAEELAQASGGADVPATDSPELRGALGDFRASAVAGIEALTDDYARTGDATSLAAVDTFLDETLPLLDRLRTMTPSSLHPRIDDLVALLGASQVELAAAVASCASCGDLGLVVAVPAAPEASQPADPVEPPTLGVPGGGASAAPGLAATAPPTGGGTGGGPLDPFPLAPAQTVVDDLLPAPQTTSSPSTQPGATSTPLLPLPTPSASLPPLPPSTSSTCLLPLPGCP